MSSQPREEGEDQQEEDEDFYDCRDSLEPPLRQETAESLDFQNKTDKGDDTERESRGGRQEEREQEKESTDRLLVEEQEEEQIDRLREKEQTDRLQEEEEEMKEVGGAVEFDDDYLREVEKELTEEEKESRRQQSLILKETGNSRFKATDWSGAEQCYTEALTFCPVCFSRERAVLFSNRAAARLHLDLKDQAISDCSRALELDPDYVRALLRRAELYEQTEKLDEALEDYKKVLDRDPSNTSARQACMRLPQQIQERNEKLKEEMIGKLKDLGNMMLRPFGLSTSNFQVNQDAASGSYSINFVQNPNNNNR